MALAISIILTWLWTLTPILNLYNLQLTGILTLVYFAFKKSSRFPSTMVLNIICLLLIFSTGGLSSPLFFLLDLLLIALALLIEPKQAIIASFLIVSIFLIQNFSILDTSKIINLLSLVLMTPVAVIFSKNYLENLQNQGRIQFLEEVVQEEETESLLWISQTKPSIASVLNSTTDLVMYFNSKGRELLIATPVLEKLKSIQSDLIALYTSASSLEKTLESESDKIRVS